MNLSKIVQETSKKGISSGIPEVKEAIIIGYGSNPNRYNIRFHSGATASDVPGQEGLSIGASVSVSGYAGNTRRYVILSDSYRATKTIKEINI